MIKIDVNYTDYRDDNDPDYPGGKAIDTPSDDSIEGTPYKSGWMNDINGFRQALFIAAFGSIDNVTNEPDSASHSDSLEAILKLIYNAITELIDNSPPSLNTLRKLAAALNNDPGFAAGITEIINDEITARAGADTAHADLTSPHGATSAATASRLMLRDSAGRAQVAAPSAAADIARKAEVDAEATAREAADALKAPLDSPAFTGNPTVPAQAAGDNSTKAANTAFVRAAIAALVDSSPAALDTLKELALALGNDPNFATTMTNALAGKAPLDSPVFTGTPKVPSKTAAAANNGTLPATEAQVYAEATARANADTAHAILIAPHGEYPIGCFFEQYPDAPTPLEAGWPGTWEIWSHRAVEYGLSTSAPTTFVDYYTLVGTTISASGRPYVCYHKSGDDWRLYRFNAHTDAYTVPAELDPVRWGYIAPGTIIERQKCANLLTANDYTIGYKITSGTYANRYVTEIIVPGGKFTGIEGGNRLTFISGGVQESRIMKIKGGTGTHWWSAIRAPSEAFYAGSAYSTPSQGTSISVNEILLDVSRVVKTGDDNAGTNLSIRVWRRTS